MYCTSCGKDLHDDAVICPACGVPTKNFKNQNMQVSNASASDDSMGCLLGGVYFLFPIVGLILYFVWKDTKPRSAKFAGKWALIGVIVNIVFAIIAGIAGGLGFGDFTYY